MPGIQLVAAGQAGRTRVCARGARVQRDGAAQLYGNGYHLEAVTGPIINPFPLGRSRTAGACRCPSQGCGSCGVSPGRLTVP